MLMLCFYYCEDLANFLFYALSFILFIFSLFVLKRGVYAHRPGLRKAAFWLMLVAAFKLFMVDVRVAKKSLLCGAPGAFPLPCTRTGMIMADMIGLVLFIGACFLVFLAYRAYAYEKKREYVSPESIHLRSWANITMAFVILMICWVAAPWVGYLTIGRVPGVFLDVSWQYFALGGLFLLLHGFWKSESCAWTFDVRNKERMRHLNSTWTPRDTLWMTVFVYIIALGLAYVATDVLTLGGKMKITQ